jgi:hypothetical protein
MRCSSIAALAPFDRALLLLRHAERGPVTDIGTHASVLLTERGLLDARVLGGLIGRRFGPVAVWHSPVPRCRQTAQALAEGAGAVVAAGATVAGPLEWLGGDFIGGEPAWINTQFAASGHDGFLRLWFDGAYAPARIAPLPEAADYEMRQAVSHLDACDVPLSIAVTHDWNLLLLRERYLGLRHEDVGLPSYLDSVALLRRGAVTTLWSLGRTARVDGP